MYSESTFLRNRQEFELFHQIISEYISVKGLRVLDLCAQWGGHMGFIVSSEATVIGCDIADYSAHFGNDYKNKILEYYSIYGMNLSSNNFELARMDAQKLAFKNSSFDIVFCVNAFEHISDPEKALREVYRILKPNGYVFISFIPVYFCDVGSHMSDIIKEPWAHLIYSEDEFVTKLKAATPDTDYFVDEFKYGLNRLSRIYFINLFEKYSGKRGLLERLMRRPHFDMLKSCEWVGVDNITYLQHENYKMLLEKYTEEDLLFRGMYVLLRKKL